MRIVYRISEQDFMEARDLFIANEKPWYRKASRLLLPWIGALVLIVQVVYVAVVPDRDIRLTVIGFLVGFYLLYCGFALRRYFRRLYQKDHRFKHDFTAEISDQGIHVITPFSDGMLKWNGFIRFLESKDIFMVFIAQWNFIIFPKRAFPPGEADQFRAALQRNIAPLEASLRTWDSCCNQAIAQAIAVCSPVSGNPPSLDTLPRSADNPLSSVVPPADPAPAFPNKWKRGSTWLLH